jgi:hypothetical protein
MSPEELPRSNQGRGKLRQWAHLLFVSSSDTLQCCRGLSGGGGNQVMLTALLTHLPRNEY